MRCPSCEELLVMSDRQGIEIDYCPKCRGVWLDRGELDKIIERSTQHQSSEKYVEPKTYYKNGHNHEHYRKKKGFLGDLFDFD
ncbi:MAG: zf-TFIIB domain-containing protein [Sphingobacteriales bacterium]|jgi:Zn-finger nucleic acid-binding protein